MIIQNVIFEISESFITYPMINKALISYLESDDDDDEIDDEDLELIQENTGIKIKKVCFFVMMMCVPQSLFYNLM